MKTVDTEVVLSHEKLKLVLEFDIWLCVVLNEMQLSCIWNKFLTNSSFYGTHSSLNYQSRLCWYKSNTKHLPAASCLTFKKWMTKNILSPNTWSEQQMYASSQREREREEWRGEGERKQNMKGALSSPSAVRRKGLVSAAEEPFFRIVTAHADEAPAARVTRMRNRGPWCAEI